MGTRFDPNHPERPDEEGDPFVRAWRNAGEEAPWLLAWRDGKVMVNAVTGRYMYDSEMRDNANQRGRGGRRH
ncbi:hypothetical protein [Rathayibacter sp. AY1B8]|uniref:hypothetical protein n=1 Tax=Rathayibacter sp. AY1B8 TaxID=2080533 RepID=UPI000CE78ECC|nr:hypothetical protein [Rathayibacter sp. AY1B8]PPI08249.1 hypothetical protein C5C63_04655 [Rathayibacter sp. AY1B8]